MSHAIRDLMTPDPATVSPGTRLPVVVETLLDAPYSGLPVVDGDRLVGLVEVDHMLPRSSNVPFSRVPVLEFQDEWVGEDELQPFVDSFGDLTVGDVMRQDPPTMRPGESAGEALHRLVTEPIRRLPIVDSSGHLVGVLTRKDLLRLFTGGV